MAGIKNYAGVSNDLDVVTKKYVDDRSTLSQRPPGDDWTFSPPSLEGGVFSLSFYSDEDIGDNWFLKWTKQDEGYDDIVGVAMDSADSASLSIEIGSYMSLPTPLEGHYGETVTATRTAPSGYVLGSQTGKPLAAAEHTHTKSQISDFPALATVATSGSYNDLTDKPDPPGISIEHIPDASSSYTMLSRPGTVYTAQVSSNSLQLSLPDIAQDTVLAVELWLSVSSGATGSVSYVRGGSSLSPVAVGSMALSAGYMNKVALRLINDSGTYSLEENVYFQRAL